MNVTNADSSFNLPVSLRIRGSVHDVFSAWVKPEVVKNWLCDRMEGEWKSGETVYWWHAEHRQAIQVTTVEKNHHLRFRWSAWGTQCETEVEVEFSELDGETGIRICESKWNLATENVSIALDHACGWENTLCRLKVWIELGATFSSSAGVFQATDLSKGLQTSLAHDLSGSEFQSLLIDVHSERVSKLTPSDILQCWQRDRFVRPSPISPVEFIELDAKAFAAASEFEPIELSPVCPLGTNTAVAPMSQNKVLGTIRNTEVVADSTNVMALECAVRRKELLRKDAKDASLVRLCSSHRLLRAQNFSGPNMTAHFRVFSLCTAGRDTGSFEFEAAAIAEHVSVYQRLFQWMNQSGYAIGAISVGIYGENEFFTSKIVEAIEIILPDFAPVKRLGSRNSRYYPTASFTLNIRDQTGEEINIGDGGLTDWTGQLLSNSKERLMISGIGTDRLISQFKVNRS